MKILLVDNQSILLDGIANLLSKSANELVEKTNTIDEALHYFSETVFDILITGYDQIDNAGLSLIRKIKKIYPNLNIIVLSIHDEAHLLEEILKKRIDNYYFKNDNHPNLADAFKSLDNSKFHLSKEIAKILENSIQRAKGKLKITSDEKIILRLIAEELNDQDIAEKLEISEKKVHIHRKSIYRKTKTSSESGLLKFVYANNLI